MNNDLEILSDGRAMIRLKRKRGDDMWAYLSVHDLPAVQAISGIWFAHKSGRNFYAQHNVRKTINGKRITVSGIMMHCLILGVNQSRENPVDHEDFNGLNNCRGNISVVTRQKNAFRRRTKLRSKSKYRNVYWSKNRDKWVVFFNYMKKRYYLGYFDNEEEANIVATRERDKFVAGAA